MHCYGLCYACEKKYNIGAIYKRFAPSQVRPQDASPAGR